MANDSSIKTARFIWHGGEPLTLGIKFFQKVLFLQNKLLSNKKICNVLQTNATLLTNKWARFLKEYNFNIGVSLDGPPEVHNIHRRFDNRGGSFSEAMRGIKILRAHNFEFGVLTVVTPELIDLGPQSLFDFYIKENIKNVGLLSLRHLDASISELLEYKQRYENFMISFLRLWLENDDINFSIREFESKLNMFFGLHYRLCKDGGPCVGNFFSIESDGVIRHCDKFRDDPRFSLGNIFEHSFEDIRRSKKIFQLEEYENNIRKRCRQCSWFNLCKGGCLFDSISLLKAGGTLGRNECLEFRIYEEFSKILARSEPVIKMIEEKL